MTDEQIRSALAEVGAAWLMDDDDEMCQAKAIRHLVAEVVASEREQADAECAVLREQLDSMRAALLKVLDARDKEAKAWFSYENAKATFQGRGALEGRRHAAAMAASSDAEREARLLLAKLKTHNASMSRDQRR